MRRGGGAGTASAMRAVVTALALAAALLASSCAEAPAENWRAGVESVLASQAAAWNRGDVAGFMEGYWKSDSLLFTSGGRVRRGWKETFEKYAASYDTRDRMGTLTFSDLEFHQPAPGAAWVFGRWEIERANDPQGGVFTLVLKKFPEGWRIVHDHTSSDPN